MAYECVHDMPDPVGVLAAMRAIARDDGYVLVMDERTAESFAAPADPVERLLYGYSIVCCLPDGLSTPGGVGHGDRHAPVRARRLRRVSRVLARRGPPGRPRDVPVLPAPPLTDVSSGGPAAPTGSDPTGAVGSRREK